MRCWLLVLTAFFVLTERAVEASEEPEDLRRRNAQLEQRVRDLEKTALAEAVDEYLDKTQPYAAEADGAESIHPRSLTLTLTGEVRIRGEVKDHVYSPMDAAGARSFQFAHMRTRVRFDADVLENLGVVVEIQDIRVLGEEESTIADTEGVDLKQGRIIFRKVGGQALDIEVGRLFMYYGDQRIIGHLEWFDQGRAYDGLRGQYSPERFFVDFFAVIVRETQPLTDDDQWFLGVYGGTKEWQSWLDAEAYVIYFADQLGMMGETGLDNTGYVALGFRLFGKQEALDYAIHATFQTGEVKGDDLGAFGFTGIVGFTFQDTNWKPRAAIEVDVASGDDDPTDGDQGGLQTLFPTNHLHYGYADVVGWQNLLALRVTVAVHPNQKVKIQLDYHHFRVLEEQGAWVNAGGGVIRTGAPGVDDHLGDEVDLTIVWKPSKPLSFLVGYSIFVPGGFIEDTGSDPLLHFFYVQTHVRF